MLTLSEPLDEIEQAFSGGGVTLRKWFVRSFMLLLVLTAYGGTAVGGRIIEAAEATESECESLVHQELANARQASDIPSRHRECRHGEIRRDRSQSGFRCRARLEFANKHFKFHEGSSPSAPPRAPPVLS